MRKPWSVTTTMRNPERLVGFLRVLAELDGYAWSGEIQERYQILLIEQREYGYGSNQFYRGLPKNIVDLIDDTTKDIPYETADSIFRLKKYEDPPMRGRQSINSLKKLGFVAIKDGKIKITELGKKLVTNEIDLGDALQNKDTYCLFIAPSIHRDTLNTYWLSNKYEYEGMPQKIIPITITQFTIILKVLLSLRQQGKAFTHNMLQNLYDSIIAAMDTVANSEEWLDKLASCLEEWALVNNKPK